MTSGDEQGPPAYVDALIAAASYRGLRAVIPTLTLTGERAGTASRLCDFAISIIDLDAEDWRDFPDIPEQLRDAASAANIPQDPDATDRGALRTLVPTFAILQEILAVRFRQGDLAGVLMVCHIMSEYLPMLAWESHLGYAGDPAQLAQYVSRPDSLWAVRRDDPRSRDCAHALSVRASLAEMVRVGTPSKEWTPEDRQRLWRNYLDRDHSRVSGALATCGLSTAKSRPRTLQACEGKCAVWHDLAGDREALADRLTLAGLFVDSALVGLRHAAPVGHGFGVPSIAELTQAWSKTWEQLTKPWAGRDNPLAAEQVDPNAEPLPGLSALVSAVAGQVIEPTRVVAEVDRLLREVL